MQRMSLNYKAAALATTTPWSSRRGNTACAWWCATQLIVPVAIAAAVSDRNADGIAQELGKKASRPAAAIENRISDGTVPQSVLLSTSNAAAVTHSGIAVCQ